jgi:hypothetical protein
MDCKGAKRFPHCSISSSRSSVSRKELRPTICSASRSRSISSYTIDVGDTVTIRVGKSVLVMKKDGTVTLNGKNIDIVRSKHVQVDSERIDLN